MTYSTLSSIVKYPFESRLATDAGKFGFFQSEKETYERIASQLGLIDLTGPDGLRCYARHPLVYIVEAADDICYEVMDLEDAHKLKILTTREVTDVLLDFFPSVRRDAIVAETARISDPNEKIGYLRSCVVGVLVTRCAEVFADNEKVILAGKFNGSLLSHIGSPERDAYDGCTRLSWDKIYGAPDVVDVELAGNRIITFLMDMFVSAVCNPDLYYSRLLLAKMPVQYDTAAASLYGRLQGVVDHMSAMTDVYALDLYRKLNGMSLPAV